MTTLAPRHIARDRVIQRLTEAERALRQVTRIDQAKLLVDAAAAQEVFAKRQQLGRDIEDFAYEIKTRALGRLGELLAALEKAKGARAGGKKSGPRGTYVEPRDSTATLANLNITKKVSAIAQRLAALPEATREAIARKETTIAKVHREQTAATRRARVRLPDSKYRVLYADPPWPYHDRADAGAIQAGGAEHHYPAMSIEEICALPVRTLVEEHAVLFLWITSPLLFEAPAVIHAWNFVYKASFVWDKVKHNAGHYNSVRHEFLLLCTRGSCTPDVPTLIDSVQSIERTTHSTKPEEFRNIITTLYPHGRRLELFARRPADGWDCFGNELSRVRA